GLGWRDGEQPGRAHPRFPSGRSAQPVVGCRRVLVARSKAFFGSLDHAALTTFAADEREDHWTRDRHGFEPVSGLPEVAAALEHLAQQMIRRAEADLPGPQRVHREIIGP